MSRAGLVRANVGAKVVAWTGHRPDLFRDPEAARQAVEAVARELAEYGTERFMVGGQRGVDTWAALAAIASGVPFSVLLPLPIDEFARDWSPADRSLLRQTLVHADDWRVVGGYSQRNLELVRHAGLLVAVWTGTGGGGTAETLDYARRAGTPVREILLERSSIAGSATGRGI
jgi:hypothetical protein